MISFKILFCMFYFLNGMLCGYGLASSGKKKIICFAVGFLLTFFFLIIAFVFRYKFYEGDWHKIILGY